MFSASPGAVLLEPGTLEIIHRTREARNQGMPVFFTLDAGATVHLLYPGKAAAEVEDFVNRSLSPYCESGTVIFDVCGNGPSRTEFPKP
jgi:diphosphomevalonate decarboxylase